MDEIILEEKLPISIGIDIGNYNTIAVKYENNQYTPIIEIESYIEFNSSDEPLLFGSLSKIFMDLFPESIFSSADLKSKDETIVKKALISDEKLKLKKQDFYELFINHMIILMNDKLENQEVKNLVLTVPPEMSEEDILMLRKSALKFVEKVHIVSAPIAIATYYDQEYQRISSGARLQVLDFGEKLTLSLLNKNKIGYIECEKSGVKDISSHYIDQLLYESVKQDLITHYKVNKKTIKEKILKSSCVSIKQKLSYQEVASEDLIKIDGKKDVLNYTMTRQYFEENILTKTLSELDRWQKILDKYDMSDIETIAVGGNSHIPAIQKKLGYVAREDGKYINAKGAALIAHRIYDEDNRDNLLISKEIPDNSAFDRSELYKHVELEDVYYKHYVKYMNVCICSPHDLSKTRKAIEYDLLKRSANNHIQIVSSIFSDDSLLTKGNYQNVILHKLDAGLCNKILREANTHNKFVIMCDIENMNSNHSYLKGMINNSHIQWIVFNRYKLKNPGSLLDHYDYTYICESYPILGIIMMDYFLMMDEVIDGLYRLFNLADEYNLKYTLSITSAPK